MNTSDRQPEVSHRVAPRHRDDSCASIPSSASQPWPPVLVRLPRLERASGTIPIRLPSPPVPSEQSDTSWQHETVEAQEPPPASNPAPASPDRAETSVPADRQSVHQPAGHAQHRLADSMATARDWRKPIYKLGATLLAVALVLVVLSALSRRHADQSQGSTGTSPDTDSVAVAPLSLELTNMEAAAVDHTASPPTQDASTRTHTGVEQPVLAENLSVPESSPPIADKLLPGQSPVAVDPPREDVAIRLGSITTPPERPTQSIEQGQTASHDVTSGSRPSAVDPQPNSSTVASTSPSAIPGSPDTARAESRPAEQPSAWPSRDEPDRQNSASLYAAQSFSARGDGQTYDPSRQTAGTPSPRGPLGYDASSMPMYPSTPYTTVFPDHSAGGVDGGGDASAARTAQREVDRYQPPPSYEADVNRAAARSQGRIEPFTTGSHEYYR